MDQEPTVRLLATKYDNPCWEYHLPVNPPGAFFDEEHDVMLTEVDIMNWYGENGLEFRPRLRHNVEEGARDSLGLAGDDEAPELDVEYDCE